ncbi:coatomer subunit zeta [Enteropsectra breve]|nr:coatomer subunit zeta [Enteropsectra breve]
MSIKNVSFIGLIDTAKTIYYSMNFDNIDVKALLESINNELEDCSIYNDQFLMVSRRESFVLVFLARPESNELFVHDAFMAFETSLSSIVKKWKEDRIFEKYDQIVLLFNEFVYNGIILVDDAEELGAKIVKRSFENVNGIKMNKGIASFISKATRSLKR